MLGFCYALETLSVMGFELVNCMRYEAIVLNFAGIVTNVLSAPIGYITILRQTFIIAG